MAGLVPAIHVFEDEEKTTHDGEFPLRRLDVGHLVEARLRFLDQLAEARPLLAKFG